MKLIGIAAALACAGLATPALAQSRTTEGEIVTAPLRFTTGKAAERWVVSPLLLVGLAVLAWHDASTSVFASHAAIGR